MHRFLETQLHLSVNRVKKELNSEKILGQLDKQLDGVVTKINTRILIKFTVDHLYMPDNLEIKEAEKL